MATTSITISDFRNIPGTKLSSDRRTVTFPTIQSKGRNGNITSWTIVVRVYDSKAAEFVEIKDEYYDGKSMSDDLQGYHRVLKFTVATGLEHKSEGTFVTSGKNIGKKNQTNQFTQALRNALSKYNKQHANIHKGSAISTSNTRDGANALSTVHDSEYMIPIVPPMLAQCLEKVSVDYSRRVYIQPKFDGVRLVIVYDPQTEKLVMYSRNSKIYPDFERFQAGLKPILEQVFQEIGLVMYLDGEAYIHGRPLQYISGRVRKGDDAELEYRVYDCFTYDIETEQFNLTEKYNKRLERLQALEGEFTKTGFVQLVETYKATSKEQVDKKYQQFLTRGFEGAMLRINKPYVFSEKGYHSKFLLKMKPTHDSEFEIIDITQGTGKNAGCLIYRCKTDKGREFNVNLSAPIEERKEKYTYYMEIINGEPRYQTELVGKMLTVQYDDLSEDGIPLRLRTKGDIRDYE